MNMEPHRQAALAAYEILDSAPEQEYDDIVHIAAHICAAPIALISFVSDDRQWFKAKVGTARCETPIRDSICVHGMESEHPLIIDDLRHDGRTADSRLVTGPDGFRFYAGAPLVSPRGDIIGMLCVIDLVARPQGLTGDQCAALQRMARQVIGLLELKLTAKRNDRAQEQREVLRQELAHRLKNTLSLVQAIAHQTLKGLSDRNVIDAFDARLMALSSAHEILLHDNWAATQMRLIVETAARVHDCGSRYRADGPAMLCGPQAALSITMLLHELSTNALKYGALSRTDGSVRVCWSIEQGRLPIFILDWREQGGPPVVRRTRRGFGSRLIRMGIAGTRDVAEHFDRSGYRVRFRAPLGCVREDHAANALNEQGQPIGPPHCCSG